MSAFALRQRETERGEEEKGERGKEKQRKRKKEKGGRIMEKGEMTQDEYARNKDPETWRKEDGARRRLEARIREQGTQSKEQRSKSA